MTKMLIDGRLADKPSADGSGRYERLESPFRHWIEPDPDARFPAEPGRYHLYVSTACPWCHRATLVRALKGLTEAITTTEMAIVMGEASWAIDQERFDPATGVPPDRFMHEVYVRADPDYTGPITVPVLWDKCTGMIVSNESADIMRMLGSAFDGVVGNDLDPYPADLRDEIDPWNAFVHERINSAVYKAGFASTQAAYDEAAIALFDAFRTIESHLEGRSHLIGERLTEPDLRLYATLVRFDAAYVTHFKLDRSRVVDHPNLHALLERIHTLPGVARTLETERMRAHYFLSHPALDSTGIVPLGPVPI